MGVGIRFGVLGPVRLSHDGTELNPGARQQRQVLAMLLARAGSVVSQTEIVDAIWGADPPASAANVLHRSVGALRRLMEPGLPARAAGSLLARVGAGYLLRVRPATLDLLAFRDLTAQARRHAEPEQAVELYRQALELWRGPCADGLHSDHPLFLGIDGERSQAARDATDAALRSGRVRRILPAVRAAAGDQPLDEALQSRLVLALAADGQREQALAVFRGVRERLADELGIDPGPELSAAHGRLQTAPPPARAGAVLAPHLVRPAQLPSDHPFFAARTDVIQQATAAIDRQRATGPATLAVDGMPGAGKTTLAIHLAHRLAVHCPDGQLYADLRGYDPQAALRPAEVLRGFLTSLGASPRDLPADPAGLARRYRELLTGRRILILLDNCPDLTTVREMLPGTPGSIALMTSRAAGAATGETLRLTLPSAGEARAGLALRLGADRITAEPGAVDEIIDHCGRLPLALALVAARIATMPETPLAEIAADLAAEPGQLATFGTGDSDLDTAFSWSYRRLTPAAARLFRLLPLHPGAEFTMPSIAALAGAPMPVARLMAGDLISHALLEQSGGRLRMHRLLRAYALGLSQRTGPHEAGSREAGQREAQEREAREREAREREAAAGRVRAHLSAKTERETKPRPDGKTRNPDHLSCGPQDRMAHAA
jgi:DNA-binding SARP family transcriptional activator